MDRRDIIASCAEYACHKKSHRRHYKLTIDYWGKFVEDKNFFVTREYTGHGVGREMHEGPQVPNYGIAGRGILLRPGMTIALEPMVLVGTPATRTLKDQWTVVSADRSLTAHYEHTVAITDNGPVILTLLEDGTKPGRKI